LWGNKTGEHKVDLFDRQLPAALGQVCARAGEAQRAIQVTGRIDLDDPETRVLLMLGAQPTVVRAAVLDGSGELQRDRAGLVVAGDLGVQGGVAKYERLEPAVVGAALAHEHLAVAQQDLRVDHGFTHRTDTAGQLPEDSGPVSFLRMRSGNCDVVLSV